MEKLLLSCVISGRLEAFSISLSNSTVKLDKFPSPLYCKYASKPPVVLIPIIGGGLKTKTCASGICQTLPINRLARAKEL